ncbi:HEAT repeat domain-containing protein [Caldicellulosiruptor naganoensis]|uniref:DUF2019 domain-containing protein n=1 Tax=Caldicellulosiruptor naganoensis TaxID=29324 RepID=A0ABY7BJV0_9FIRM|nr:HEAT repeat domain-containing protein [Caldicellulosiruptor naganoensis]WAM32025.1 DUF2019 domain-containing protein [Caldicellulosiruptor naganoensis]
MKDVKKLIEEYRNAAILQKEASSDGDYRTANKQYSRLTKIYKILEKDKDLREKVLRELLKDENIYVSSWAAAHCLGLNIYVDEAVKLLEEIAKRKDIGILRLDAEMTLKVWREEGQLKFY